MSHNKNNIYHQFKTDILRFQTIIELFLFEENCAVQKNEMLKDGDLTLEDLKKQWENIKECYYDRTQNSID